MARGEIVDVIDYNVDDDGDDGRAESARSVNQPDGPKLLSKLDKPTMYRVLRGHWFSDQEASSKWRAQATDDFGFKAGDQLNDEDKALLDAQQRPHVVFNRVETILKAVAGMEINGRHDVKYQPRNTEDTAVNEVLSSASVWMSQGCDAEDEQSQAFQDCCVCGIGVTEARFSYDEDPEGGYIEEQFDPREFYWDRTARKKNLKDARRLHRLRRMSYYDAASLFPGFNKTQLDATWAVGYDMDKETKSYEQKLVRDGDDSEDEFDDKNEVTIVCSQWWERCPIWLVADPQTNTKIELTDHDYQRLKARMEQLGMPLIAVRMHRKRFYQAFLGNTLLAVGPAPAGDQFSWGVMTGEYDKKKRQWYGLIRVMRDPQMWANKFFSQIMHIMNSTAKGGIIAESDAFDDQREAEDTYAMPDDITWAAKGALSGQKPKIMPKPGQGNAEAYVQMLQFAVSSMKDVTGINLELLGQQDQNQPGVLEYMRKQAGMTVLATQFDSLRRYLKIVGRQRLFFIQNRMSDGRLIRVVGDDYVEAVRLAKENTTGTYDVIVDDAPTSPNQKEANWAIMQPMLAVFKEQLMGNPKVLCMILKYSPLPAPLVAAIEKVVTDAENNPENQQYQQQLKQLGLAKLIAEITKDQSTADMNKSKAQGVSATATYDVAMAQNLMEDNQREREKHTHSTGMDIVRASTDAQLAASKVAETRAKTAKTMIEARQMAQPAQQQPLSHAEILKHRTDMLRAQSEHLGRQQDHGLAVAQHVHQVDMDHRDHQLAAGELAINARDSQHQQGMDQRQHEHQVRNDDRSHALDRLSAQAGFHQSMASAFKARKDAVRPQPKAK